MGATGGTQSNPLREMRKWFGTRTNVFIMDRRRSQGVSSPLGNPSSIYLKYPDMAWSQSPQETPSSIFWPKDPIPWSVLRKPVISGLCWLLPVPASVLLEPILWDLVTQITILSEIFSSVGFSRWWSANSDSWLKQANPLSPERAIGLTRLTWRNSYWTDNIDWLTDWSYYEVNRTLFC